jgi:predicted TPR repeat methyltransferase
VLDLGCGNGGKLAELVRAGAGASVGIDISGNFITNSRPSVGSLDR